MTRLAASSRQHSEQRPKRVGYLFPRTQPDCEGSEPLGPGRYGGGPLSEKSALLILNVGAFPVNLTVAAHFLWPMTCQLHRAVQ